MQESSSNSSKLLNVKAVTRTKCTCEYVKKCFICGENHFDPHCKYREDVKKLINEKKKKDLMLGQGIPGPSFKLG